MILKVSVRRSTELTAIATICLGNASNANHFIFGRFVCLLFCLFTSIQPSLSLLKNRQVGLVFGITHRDWSISWSTVIKPVGGRSQEPPAPILRPTTGRETAGHSLSSTGVDSASTVHTWCDVMMGRR